MGLMSALGKNAFKTVKISAPILLVIKCKLKSRGFEFTDKFVKVHNYHKDVVIYGRKPKPEPESVCKQTRSN